MDILQFMGVNSGQQLSNIIVWFFMLAVVYGIMQTILLIMLISNTDDTTKAVKALEEKLSNK